VEVFYKISRSLHFIKEGAVICNNMRSVSGCQANSKGIIDFLNVSCLGIRTLKQVKLYVLRKLLCEHLL